MDYKDYLLNTHAVRLAYIAQKMWPNNKNAKSYLSSKLTGKLNWSAADNKKAKNAIKALGFQLLEDTSKD